jgi:hypothetical protein
VTSITQPTVPLWAEVYLPDFVALRLILERSVHFVLQPVETPSVDIIWVLADWLEEQKWDLCVISLAETDSWKRLLDDLRAPTSLPRAVIVIAPNDLHPDVMRVPLARINMQRDSLARGLDCPLLWCGTVELLRLTWEFAPDFWSIAATPFRVAVREVDEARRTWVTAGQWWTGAAAEDLSSLEEAFDSAHKTEDKERAARLGLRLAECQITRRDLAAAASTLSAVSPMLTGAAATLTKHWRRLQSAIDLAELKPDGDPPSSLRQQIKEAESRGARLVEAQLRVKLARQLWADPELHGQALTEFRLARNIRLEEGDIQAALAVDASLVAWSTHPPDPSFLQEIQALSERVLREHEDWSLRTGASLILASVYYWSERRQEADDLAREALAECESLDRHPDFVLHGLKLRSLIAMDRGDHILAHALQTKMIETAKVSQSTFAEIYARQQRAETSIALKNPVQAADDFIVASELADRIGSIANAAFYLVEAATMAFSLDAPRVGVVLILRAVLRFLRHFSAHGRSEWHFDTEVLRKSEPEIADRLDALKNWLEQYNDTTDMQIRLLDFDSEFRHTLALGEAQLRVLGIAPLNSETWANESPRT